MASRLEKLQFIVGLVDKASGPAGKIVAQIDQITQRAQKGMQKIATGAGGLFATGYALNSLMGPSVEMSRALGEVKSLDVSDSALKMLKKTALKTSVQYGDSAADIVRSSYDIQSAIGGLSDLELSSFTRASAVLAKGTKSDTSTITDYMGTMYGIFKNSADAMGKSQWVEQMTGQTATAVQMFKTTGSEMAGAFGNLGAEAQSHGVAISEQMAVLGQLQATMSGSEAGTKYKAFLAGVGKAQDELGLKFVDSQGQLLPMMDILDKLRGKFGDTLDVAESDALKKAFGSKEASGLIKLLMQDMDGLQSNIGKLDNISGMEQAEKMAKSIADPWERLGAAGTAIKTIFGQIMQPVLVPAAEWLIRMGENVVTLTDKYPTLTKVIGVAVLVIFGLVAAVSAFALASGIAQVALAGLQTVLLAARIGMLLFSAALWANPITWVVLGIAALIAAIVMAVRHWDDIKAAALGFVDDVMAKLADLKTWVAGLNPFQALGPGIDWLIKKINLIPGININTKGSQPSVDPAASLGGPEDLRGGSRGLQRESIVPSGGLQQQINNRGTTIEKMEVNTTGGVNGFQLTDELMMAGG